MNMAYVGLAIVKRFLQVCEFVVILREAGYLGVVVLNLDLIRE